MITVFVKLDCGCCSTEMQFNDEASASTAFEKVGMGNNMSMTDDAGQTHTGLDTFYGFALSEEGQNTKGIGYLADLVASTVRTP